MRVKTRRPYQSPLREQRARANREAVLQAARRRFIADGYPRTSVASIAAEAGVSEDLVYLLFKNKRRLLVKVLNFAVTGDSTARACWNRTVPAPDMDRLIVGGLGWDVERYAEWLRRTLEAALLPPLGS